MGFVIDDKEMAMVVLNVLSRRFQILIEALDALESNENTFRLEYVKSCLLQEAQRVSMKLARRETTPTSAIRVQIPESTR